jgi:hypothetical protein
VCAYYRRRSSAAGRLGGLHQRRQLLFKVRQRQHCSKRRDVAGVERSAQLHAQLRSSVRRGGGHVDVQRAACVYKLGRPEVFVNAASAAMIMGWSSLLDTSVLPIEPGDSATLAKLSTVARMIRHRVPQHCNIRSFQKIINAALRGAGFSFSYAKVLRRRSGSARVKYDCCIACDQFPGFLDAHGLVPGKALGRAPLSAFLSIANHSCGDGKSCGYELCPKRASFQAYAEHAAESIARVIDAIRRRDEPVVEDLAVAERLRDICASAPLALVDGRFARQLGDLEHKYAVCGPPS